LYPDEVIFWLHPAIGGRKPKMAKSGCKMRIRR